MDAKKKEWKTCWLDSFGFASYCVAERLGEDFTNTDEESGKVSKALMDFSLSMKCQRAGSTRLSFLNTLVGATRMEPSDGKMFDCGIFLQRLNKAMKDEQHSEQWRQIRWTELWTCPTCGKTETKKLKKTYLVCEQYASFVQDSLESQFSDREGLAHNCQRRLRGKVAPRQTISVKQDSVELPPVIVINVMGKEEYAANKSRRKPQPGDAHLKLVLGCCTLDLVAAVYLEEKHFTVQGRVNDKWVMYNDLSKCITTTRNFSQKNSNKVKAMFYVLNGANEAKQPFPPPSPYSSFSG